MIKILSLKSNKIPQHSVVNKIYIGKSHYHTCARARITENGNGRSEQNAVNKPMLFTPENAIY